MTRLQAALLCSRCAGRAQAELIPSVHQQGGQQTLPVLPNRVLGRAGQRHRAVGAGQEDCGRQGIPREGEGCWLCSALLGRALPSPSAAPRPLAPSLPCLTTSEGALPSPLVFHRQPWLWVLGCAGARWKFSAGRREEKVPAELCHRRPAPPPRPRAPCASLWGRWMCRKAPGWDFPSALGWGGVCVCLVSAGAVSKPPRSSRLAGRGALAPARRGCVPARPGRDALTLSVPWCGGCGMSSASPLGSSPWLWSEPVPRGSAAPRPGARTESASSRCSRAQQPPSAPAVLLVTGGG